tara:strand:+ start:601 stop:4797 length:4197 start_codon:yes stop_codon:yes gene_type:complete
MAVAVRSEFAIIDVIASSHTKDGGGLYLGEASHDNLNMEGCNLQGFDGFCRDSNGVVASCNCPDGTQCVEKDALIAGDVNTCRGLTKGVHQGASGYDYESANVISSPTQVDWLAFTDVATDGGSGAGRADKFHVYRVYLKEVSQDKYTGCEVSLTGALMTVTDGEADQPVLEATPTFDKSVTGQVLCEFRPLNKGYLGLINVNVTFTKDYVLLANGEKSIESVETHLRYVPGADDNQWHNPLDADWATFGPKVFPDHDKAVAVANRYASANDMSQTATSVFQFDAAGDYAGGYKSAEATALKGTVKLPIRGVFFDARYKIVEQSGVESLTDGIGDGAMRKEGMEIHYDFKNFYDSSKNAFENAGINMNPEPLFSNYLTGLDASLTKHAQYVMEHEYTLTFGGYVGNQMPHFSKDYLSCPLCDARIVFKAFEASDAYTGDGTSAEKKDYLLRYHGTVDVSLLPTSTNTISLDDIDVTAVENVIGHTTNGGSNVALRLPTEDDPQFPDGHALGEFFTVVKADAQTVYTSLTAPFDLIGTRLGITNEAGADIKATVEQGCTAAGSGPLYQLSGDIVAKAQEIFDSGCRIKVPKTAFGTKTTLTYTNAQTVSTTSDIIETDERQIFSGNTELSLLQRKTDTAATTSGPQVTFTVSKVGVTGAVAFTIKGSNTMLGYGNDGVECTQAQVDDYYGEAPDPAVHKQCKDVLKTDENKVSTSADDSVATTVTIRSSSDCFLYMDVDLVDDTAPFAVYGIRLPCVRTTDKVQDSLNLTYAFSSSYSLSLDRFSAEIDYELPTDMKLSVFEKGFGICAKNASNFDILSVPATCVDVGGGAQPIAGWADDSSGKIVLDKDDKVDLVTLKNCDNTDGGIADTDDNYQVEHYLGLVYRRDFLEGGRTQSRTYCQDQKFVTSLRRDATASVTVATLVSASLERSVMVSSIDWLQCASTEAACQGYADCFKMRIDLDAREKDTSAAVWANATLKDVFDPQSGGVNTDSMTIVHSMTATGTDNVWSLESGCGYVASCLDGEGTHYGDLSAGTEQDLIIRGAFNNVDVDTDVKIKTKFSECPLQVDTTDLGGQFLLGLNVACEAPDGSGGWTTDGSGAVTSADSDVTRDDDADGTDEVTVQNCATAYASGKATITADIYLDGKNSSGLTNAAAWSFRDVDFKINRYETDTLGNKDPSKLVSSDLMMEMRYQSGSADYTCTKKKSGLTGLPAAFDAAVLVCPAATGNTEAAISKMEIDLQPLQSANMDVFEVEVIAVLRNGDLETRRLRKIFRLTSSGIVDESSSGFQVIVASKDISDRTEGNTNEDLHEHLESIDTAIIVTIAIVSTIAGLALLYVLNWYFGCCGSPLDKIREMKNERDMEKEKKKAKAGEGASLTGGVAGGDDSISSGFKNLRY